MASTDQHLDEWQSAGLLDDAATTRIRAYERDKHARRPTETDERPGVLEAMLYLGVAIVAVGAFALGAQNWGELESWARVAVLAVPGILAILAGFALISMPEAQFRRAGHVAWLASVALLTGAIAVALNEYGGGDSGDDRTQVLLLAMTATVLAATLWALAPSNPQVLGLAGSLFFLATAIGNWPDDYSTEVAGVTMLLFGGAALLLVEGRLLAPPAIASALFAIMAAWGPYFAGIDNDRAWPEALAFATAIALIGLSVWRSSFTYMVVGVSAFFLSLITFVFEHFSEDLGAPLALILSGGLVIAAVLLLTQMRGYVRGRKASAA